MIKYLNNATKSSSDALVTQVYSQIKRDFGEIGEPFILHSPSPSLLAGAWMACRETELTGVVRREVKEAVAAAVSKINQCPYCVDAHTMMIMATGNKRDANSISEDKLDEISDPTIKSMVAWALKSRSPGSPVLHHPPFSQQEAPEMIGTAVFYHYLNRMVSVLLNETPFPTSNPLLKKMLKFVAAKFLFSSSVKQSNKSGESIHFLPDVPLPDDLNWARTNPVISNAFSRFAAVVEQAGSSILSEESRFTVSDYMDQWDGKAPGISRKWLELAVDSVNGPQKVAVKLALLTAIAPYQVDDELIRQFKAHYNGDEQLLNLLAWSSFTAARKIGTWLDCTHIA